MNDRKSKSIHREGYTPIDKGYISQATGVTPTPPTGGTGVVSPHASHPDTSDQGPPAGALPKYGETVWRLRSDEAETVWSIGDAISRYETGQTLGDLLALKDQVNAALIGWQYEWKPCSCSYGYLGASSMEVFCTACGDHATYGLQAGQVPVKCETCDSTGPECLDGYRGREVAP